MALQLFISPDLARLLEHLAETLRRAPLPPREHDIIVVQSQGMRRWLTLQLADAFGCIGSLSLPFPAAFVRELGGRLSLEPAARDEPDLFSRDVLVWRIDALLRALVAGDARFEALGSYLAAADERAGFGLASQIAARFDDYQMFRADILGQWEAGVDVPGTRHAAWQATLWRMLCGGANGVPHLAARLRRSIDRLHNESPIGLPTRVTVFGVSTLPPLFVDLLTALARHVPVSVYSASLAPAAPHAIAVAFGTQSREFLAALVQRGARVTDLGDRARTPSRLLSRLQGELASQNDASSPLTIDAHDDSLRVHSAHGNLRQVEILRDQLLAALAADPTLRPHDILMLVPDAAAWAPMVDAVFGVAADATPVIPYRIADRPIRRSQPAAEAVLRLLALEGGRLERSEVLGFLSHPLARQAAGLSEGDVESLEALIERANVRWGYDAGERKALRLPAYEDASWRAGLDRLLLGTMVGRSDDLVLDVLPVAGDMAGDPETLATFAKWIDTLASALAGWRSQRTLADWVATLIGAVECFLRAEDSGEEQMVTALCDTIRRLEALGSVASYAELVPFAVVRDWLEGELDAEGFGGGFLQGGMTVAAIKPMRSLPFRVIAVAGLDDGVFPRGERRSAFDLLEMERRDGDRDLRTDDRQLFLDLLLAAQDYLILSYSGRAVSDNSPRAPSVVIDELLDHLDRRSTGAARRALVVTHPLQPFSTAYFEPQRDPRLFTYSHAQANAARSRANREDSDRPFVDATIDPPPLDAGIFDLSLRDLTECWMNPSRFYCRRVLQFSFGGDARERTDDDVFTPDYLQRGRVKAGMLATALSGTRDPQTEVRRVLADGSLPPRAIGRAWHVRLNEELAEILTEVPLDVPATALPITLAGAGWRLKGRIEGIRGGRRFMVRAGRVRAEHWIRVWVEHVAMCSAREQGLAGVPDTTVVIGKECNETLGPARGATALLAQLVAVARDGYSVPLPFFPSAAWAWREARYPKAKKSKRVSKREPQDPRAAAEYAFSRHSSQYDPTGGDHEDAYIALCFRGTDPITARWDDFETLVTLLFSGWPNDEAHS